MIHHLRRVHFSTNMPETVSELDLMCKTLSVVTVLKDILMANCFQMWESILLATISHNIMTGQVNDAYHCTCQMVGYIRRHGHFILTC